MAYGDVSRCKAKHRQQPTEERFHGNLASGCSGAGCEPLQFGNERRPFALAETFDDRRLHSSPGGISRLQNPESPAGEFRSPRARVGTGGDRQPAVPPAAPAEQLRLVRLLIDRVEYDGGQNKVSITFRPGSFASLLAEPTASTQEKRL
jgi:hypothetical protein